MSVTVRALLEDRYFMKCKVLAGHRGLDREIQSVALFDAPDGYIWYKGNEFVLSSGYLFRENIELFKKVIIHLYEHNCAAFGIKVGRYLKQIPQEILDLCNQFNIPLINIPYEPAWVEIMDMVNAIAMNKYFMRANANHEGKKPSLSVLYPEYKISELIENLSRELRLSVSVIDFLENKHIHYPGKEKNTKLDQELNELLNPSFDFKQEKIYDKINIYRRGNLETQQSWVIIPIKINGVLVSKLIIWEKGKELGYFDLLVIRLTFDILFYIYGQIYYMNSKEANFQDDLIREILFEEIDKEKLLRKAKNLYWDVQKKYICVSFKLVNQQLNLDNYRDLIHSITRRYFSKKETPLGLLEGCLIIFYPVENHLEEKEVNDVKSKCNQLITALEKEIPLANVRGGIAYTASALYSMKKSYIESMKTVEIGQYIYPDSKVLLYHELGPFGLIHLESFKDNLDYFNEKINPILKQDDWEESISTLKTFLESNCNYSLTAKKLFIHNNTVRYRIAKIQQLCQINLEDSMERLKLEIILKFVTRLNV